MKPLPYAEQLQMDEGLQLKEKEPGLLYKDRNKNQITTTVNTDSFCAKNTILLYVVILNMLASCLLTLYGIYKPWC